MIPQQKSKTSGEVMEYYMTEYEILKNLLKKYIITLFRMFFYNKKTNSLAVM